MIPIVLLGVLAAVGYVCTVDKYDTVPRGEGGSQDAGERDFGTHKTSLAGMQHTYMRDFHDAGIFWGMNRPQMLNMTNLNDAWKPYSAPQQKSTRSLFQIYKNEAEKEAYLGQYAHPFYFMKDGEIPLASAEQSNPNVEIPCKGQSIRGDTGNSLAFYPRAYADLSQCDGNTPHIFSKKGERIWNAGQPTEEEEVYVPREGQVNREFNPWGPGGVLQRLFSTRNERETRRKGVDRAVLTVPPPSSYYNSKYR
jgi:hypothetical protein